MGRRLQTPTTTPSHGFDSAWDSARRAGRYHVSGSCSPDDTEHYIEMLDTAIDYANTKFQADVLPHYVRGRALRQSQGIGAAERIEERGVLSHVVGERSWGQLSRRDALDERVLQRRLSQGPVPVP
jgi:hypothetical protein